MSRITRRPVIDASTLEAIGRTIGDTNNGLTGTEIGNFLSQSKINDVSPGITNRYTLMEKDQATPIPFHVHQPLYRPCFPLATLSD